MNHYLIKNLERYLFSFDAVLVMSIVSGADIL